MNKILGRILCLLDGHAYKKIYTVDGRLDYMACVRCGKRYE